MAHVKVEITKGFDTGLYPDEVRRLRDHTGMSIDSSNYLQALSILGEDVECYRAVIRLRKRIYDISKPIKLDDALLIESDLHFFDSHNEIRYLLMKYLIGWGAIKITPMVASPIMNRYKLGGVSKLIKYPKMNAVEYEILIRGYMYNGFSDSVKLALSRCVDPRLNRPLDASEWAMITIDPVFYFMITRLDYELASNVGMNIPLWASGEEDEYFIDNIHYYYRVKPGENSDIRLMSDDEIFQKMGKYFYYESRDDLVSKALSLQPIIVYAPLSKSVLDTSINKHALSGESIKESFDAGLSMFMIYMNDEHHIVLIDELIHCWKSLKDIVLPHDINVKIPYDVVMEIKLMAKCYNTDEFKEVISVINELIRKEEAVDAENMDLIHIVSKLPDEDREKIKVLLVTIFEVAMYLRGWDGVPDKYPLKKANTTPEWDVQEKATAHLITLSKILEHDVVNGIYRRLYNYEYEADSLRRHLFESNFKSYIDSVMNGIVCIRVASKILCNTSTYYLYLLLGETIKGYNHENIDEIW